MHTNPDLERDEAKRVLKHRMETLVDKNLKNLDFMRLL